MDCELQDRSAAEVMLLRLCEDEENNKKSQRSDCLDDVCNVTYDHRALDDRE
jgi:hypothetical protein